MFQARSAGPRWKRRALLRFCTLCIVCRSRKGLRAFHSRIGLWLVCSCVHPRCLANTDNVRLRSMLLTLWVFPGNSLYLPRPNLPTASQSDNVTHPHFRLGCGAQLPINQCHLYWGMARRVRSHDTKRLDWRGNETRARPHDLCGWPPGQHVS